MAESATSVRRIASLSFFSSFAETASYSERDVYVPRNDGDQRDERPATNILTAKEAKNLLKCGLSTIYDMFEVGELRGFRLKTSGKRNGIRIFATSIDKDLWRDFHSRHPQKSRIFHAFRPNTVLILFLAPPYKL